jgi:Holliday junction resolvasome RuvABC endonuclease subunit
VFDSERNLIDLGYIRLKSSQSVFSRVTEVSKVITDISGRFDIESVFIEENLQAFRPGMSSAKTLLTLARFNGMVSYEVHKITGCDPVYVNVNTARKLIGLKINRKSEKSTKDQVHEWVSNDLKISNTNVAWPFKILKSGPRKGMEILDTAAYDMSDAYVICKAGMSL